MTLKDVYSQSSALEISELRHVDVRGLSCSKYILKGMTKSSRMENYPVRGGVDLCWISVHGSEQAMHSLLYK
jgi:hypothetical protein